MTRRRLLIALAVAVPLAIFIAANWATRWRPVKIGALPAMPRLGLPTTLRASNRYLIAGATSSDNYTLFDLQTQTQRRIRNQTLLEDGDLLLQLRASSRVGAAVAPGNVQLVMSGDGPARVYVLRGFSMSGTLKSGFSAETMSRSTVRVSPDLDRVELVFSDTYYRWSQTSRAPQRKAYLIDFSPINGFVEESVAAIARDGESVVSLNSRAIEWRSTRDGRVLKSIALRGFRASNQTSEQIGISNFGALALYNLPVGGINSTRWEVRDAQNGRVKWKFKLPFLNNRAVFSPDEKWLALPSDGLHWDIRDAQTGVLARQLPRLPNVSGAAFAPDNSTLYSVANGVLYRQRAR